jgi:hypothetical protein
MLLQDRSNDLGVEVAHRLSCTSAIRAKLCFAAFLLDEQERGVDLVRSIEQIRKRFLRYVTLHHRSLSAP